MPTALPAEVSTPTHVDPVELLSHGQTRVLGQIPDASNATFLVVMTAGSSRVGTRRGGANSGVAVKAVYKPARGEAPLRDFEQLARREVAAYRLSALTGLACVPPTVLREDLPYGPGSVQLYVDAAPVSTPQGSSVEQGSAVDQGSAVGVWMPEAVPSNVAPVLMAQSEDGNDVVIGHVRVPRLFTLALFDVLVNNADRKGSHILHGRLPYASDALGAPAIDFWGIDNGLTFHPQPKLRTVLWGFAGENLGADHLRALEVTQALTGDDLGLTPTEVRALHARARFLERTGQMPHPPTNRYPIPWPPL